MPKCSQLKVHAVHRHPPSIYVFKCIKKLIPKKSWFQWKMSKKFYFWCGFLRSTSLVRSYLNYLSSYEYVYVGECINWPRDQIIAGFIFYWGENEFINITFKYQICISFNLRATVPGKQERDRQKHQYNILWNFIKSQSRNWVTKFIINFFYVFLLKNKY